MKVVGIIPGDSYHQKMREIYINCKHTGVSIPREVEEYFEKRSHTLDGEAKEAQVNFSEWDHTTEKGVDIQVGKDSLPDGVTIIRVYKERYW